MSQVQVIFIRHGHKEEGADDKQAGLDMRAEERALKLADQFRGLGVKPDHYFTSKLPHASETAAILHRYLSESYSKIIEVEALTPGKETESQFNLENIIQHAHKRNVDLKSPSPKTLAFVGHEGRLSQLITRV